tara:strand:- start:736 stop:945 length:210 start_codon:yes stop_codon:yes gene_type:complete
MKVDKVDIHLQKISSDIEHIKEITSKMEQHLEKLNGRVRANESKISMIFGVGIVSGIIFSGFITFLLIA